MNSRLSHGCFERLGCGLVKRECWDLVWKGVGRFGVVISAVEDGLRLLLCSEGSDFETFCDMSSESEP